VYTVV